MVLQTSEIADTPPTRRSRAARVPPDGLAGPIRVLGIGGPVLLALYMASMFLPMAFVIGGLRITPYAGLLIIFIGPMFLVAETLVVLGQRNDLAEAMGEGNVTAR